ncbi:MAG: tetratricopeptide repeat protein, partial [Rhizobiales bacterium]|nr:tetratricopeptide repeat protein [Rhizobacter sp.]
TLMGHGGVGKTRLARRALATLGAAFRDGAVFVEAEAVTSPSQFGPRLAEALGVRSNAGLDAMQTAVAALAGREQLIVIDNFEDLVPHAGALLEPLLAASPKIKLLMTSRVRLSVASEWCMPLEGLPVPDPEDEDRAEAFDAVRLFVQAARRVELGFLLSSDAAAVVDICRRVEGLPLALELAAAWVRVLPPKAIAAELREGLELLRARDASQPPRHASIEFVFGESWRRLAPAERDALARLSVFRGGFTAAAARAVAGAALPVLGALIDKSLLRKDTGGERLSLHPLIQQMAAARLDTAGLQAATAFIHATYFHRWLQGFRPGAADGDGQTLSAIDADFENLRQAWSLAITQGNAAKLAKSGSTLLDWAENRARFDGSLGLWLEALKALKPTRQTRGGLALLAAQAARIEYRLARFSEAEAHGRRALADTNARNAADREARHEALTVLGGCATSLGSLDDACRFYEQALAVARAGTMLQEVAGTLENLALVLKRQGRYEESLTLLRQALAEHRRIGNNASVALSLSNLGSMLMFMNDDEAAGENLREALALAERDGLVSTRAYVLANLTELALRAKDWKAARGHAERALGVARDSGLRPLAGWLEVQLARLATRDGDLDAARRALAEGAALAIALKASSIAAAALLAWAELLEAQGHTLPAQGVLAFGVHQPQFSAPDREELRMEWNRRVGSFEAEAPVVPPWPQAISLGLLLGRIVAERDTSYVALLRLLC